RVITALRNVELEGGGCDAYVLAQHVREHIARVGAQRHFDAVVVVNAHRVSAGDGEIDPSEDFGGGIVEGGESGVLARELVVVIGGTVEVPIGGAGAGGVIIDDISVGPPAVVRARKVRGNVGPLQAGQLHFGPPDR